MSDAADPFEEPTEQTIEQFDFPTRSVCVSGVICYIVGLLPLALRSGDHPLWDLGVWHAVLWFVGWHFVVVLVGFIGSVRANFFARGELLTRSIFYGIAWSVAGSTAVVTLVTNTYLKLSDDQIIYLAHAAAMGCSCALFWAGAAIWGDRAQAAIGFVLAFGVFFAVMLGPDLYFWVMLVVLPLAFAVGALLSVRKPTARAYDVVTRQSASAGELRSG